MILMPQPRFRLDLSSAAISGVLTPRRVEPVARVRDVHLEIRRPGRRPRRRSRNVELDLAVRRRAVLEGVDAGFDDGHLDLVDLVAAHLHPLAEGRNLRRRGDLHLRRDRNGQVHLATSTDDIAFGNPLSSLQNVRSARTAVKRNAGILPDAAARAKAAASARRSGTTEARTRGRCGDDAGPGAEADATVRAAPRRRRLAPTRAPPQP